MTTGNESGGSNGPAEGKSKKPGWPKGKKRRVLPKDANAPKAPLSGYMLYMAEQRDVLRVNNPGITFAEVTRIVAQQWNTLPADTKNKFLHQAEQDKERYQREIEEYQKTDSYKNFLKEHNKAEEAEVKKMRKEEERKELEEEIVNNNTHNSLEIPIFTEEFLNHNKAREAELRQLRKSNTDYEEQNAILQKHIESMKTSCDRLECEMKEMNKNNEALQHHLNSLRLSLCDAFQHLQLPDSSNVPPSLDTIEQYLAQLQVALQSNPPQSLVQNVRSIVNQLST